MKHHPTPVIERLLARIEIDSNGCWLWQGTKLWTGHGRITLGRREEGTALVHRVTWTHYNGPVPEGLELDHLCREPSCCNPDHLEAVTHGENLYRGELGSRKIVCPRGHYVLGDNVYIQTKGVGRPQRSCRICSIDAAHRSERRKTEARRAAKKAAA